MSLLSSVSVDSEYTLEAGITCTTEIVHAHYNSKPLRRYYTILL